MATYTTLRKGSTGDDVKRLQTALGIVEDGIYGPKTEAAVKEYQKANGLSVDGIAGNQTLGALYGASTATTSTPKYQLEMPTMPEFKDFEYEKFDYGDINQSDTVKQAQEMLQQHLAQKPGEYQSQWQSQLTDVINKIMNREKFSYDVNGDALYQQYKDQYVTQGQMAMQDAMGQAAAMTGGYGNSYAQSVGQQTYQGYLQQLNDKVPELYQLALSKYNQEGQDMLNQYALLGDQENLDYSRYRDTVSDYYTNLDYLTGRADAEWNKEAANRDFAYGQYSDDKGYAYQNQQDKLTHQWQQAEMEQAINQINTNLAYQQDRDKVSDEQWQKTYELQSKGSSGGSGGGGGDEGKGYDNGALTESEVKQIQAALGIEADGKWGPKSVEASGGMTAGEAYTAWKNGTLGENTYEYEMAETTATNSFKASVLTQAEFNKRGKTTMFDGKPRYFSSYEDYLDAVLEKWHTDLKLTDDEVATLISYYGLS